MVEKRMPVGVLGATGMVGQRLVSLLGNHPLFELTHLYSSSRTAGKRYGDALGARMLVSAHMLTHALDMQLREPEAEGAPPVVFSALSSSAAKEIEPLFLLKGSSVCSNASAFRMDDCVPIILADVNPEHIEIIARQKKEKGWNGYLVTNSNCSTSGIVTALAPLAKYSISNVSVSTYQALSGAGFPGHAAITALGNVIPHILGEEEKIAAETRKMLGSIDDEGQIVPQFFPVEAFCARVPVINGHMISMNFELGSNVSVEKIADDLREWRGIDLPSAPKRVISVVDDSNRPQHMLDLECGEGYTVTVGRIRKLETGRMSLVVLVDNLIRGAAGACVLNAELLHAKGYV